jgi:alkanesulfonate monooxygenase SsuD/methylene tetrahydromethanopterin reductase-like flavin-dependent oxidoreductase (luciferase family)
MILSEWTEGNRHKGGVMKFGHFLFHTNMDPSKDAEAIQDALSEAKLAEELEYDAVWFSEHHFSGEVVYADPLIFGSAVAAQTKKILLGMAVVELALNNPVRVAIQTSVIDNVSQGRLLVGVARGSIYSAFEFRGFGTDVTEAIARTEESEELLIKAWTTEDGLEYDGKYWQVAFPRIRPRPYQKPHPPLIRAGVSNETVAAMGKIGRPVMLRTTSADHAREQITLYKESMLSAGFDDAAVEKNLDLCWIWRDVYVAETTEQALDEFRSGFEHYEDTLAGIRERWSPPDQPVVTRVGRMLDGSVNQTDKLDSSQVSQITVGSAKHVKDRFIELKDAGVRNVLLTHRGRVVTKEQGRNSMRLLAEQVFPSLK